MFRAKNSDENWTRSVASVFSAFAYILIGNILFSEKIEKTKKKRKQSDHELNSTLNGDDFQTAFQN